MHGAGTLAVGTPPHAKVSDAQKDVGFAASGNRTRLSRVTGGDTDRYTNATLLSEGCSLGPRPRD